jgi:hypothetical protein
MQSQQLSLCAMSRAGPRNPSPVYHQDSEALKIFASLKSGTIDLGQIFPAPIRAK